MPRTTAEEVEAIVEVDDEIDLDPFIELANELVTEKCASVTTYTDNRLKLIEKLLAAHFYCIRDPRSTREEVTGIRDTYEAKVDLHLDLTRYGQQAMFMDTNGGLAAWNNSLKTVKVTPTVGRPSVGINWSGTTIPDNCTEPDYDEEL